MEGRSLRLHWNKWLAERRWLTGLAAGTDRLLKPPDLSPPVLANQVIWLCKINAINLSPQSAEAALTKNCNLSIHLSFSFRKNIVLSALNGFWFKANILYYVDEWRLTKTAVQCAWEKDSFHLTIRIMWSMLKHRMKLLVKTKNINLQFIKLQLYISGVGICSHFCFSKANS